MSKKDFGKNLKPKKRTKPSNDDIEKALGGEEIQESKPSKVPSVRFNIRMSKPIFDRLDRVAQELGVSKKSILMQGLRYELDRLEKK